MTGDWRYKLLKTIEIRTILVSLNPPKQENDNMGQYHIEVCPMGGSGQPCINSRNFVETFEGVEW